MAKWSFTCIDNGGKRQFINITANDKTTAIRKGMDKAVKNAKGDIYQWDCKLVRA